ncbi:nuclear transport factor 2 family protein [Pantoea sp. App145]|uniref:nuclear transport factor 2 family protein n=1 Tax=Pantoea sp. App145 TaxID=3071567 RepID=UPI003A80A866
MTELIHQLLAFEQQRQRALIEADLTALENMLAADLIHIHSTGMVHTKAQFLAHVKRMGGFVSIQREPPDIRVEGDIAILTGNTRNRVRRLETGEEAERYGFSTLVLRRTAGGWQILLSQLTPHQV